MKLDYSNTHREIIEGAKENNRFAQYQLYQLYAKSMYNTCYRMMNNKEEAEDLLQDSFSEAFLKIKFFRYESSFGAWLKQIVINKCINAIKKKSIEVNYFEDYGSIDEKDEKEDIFEDVDLEVERIRRAIEKLPNGFRIIISLYLLEGYDHKEISSILDISESTSKTQYIRAKKKIREILKTPYHE